MASASSEPITSPNEASRVSKHLPRKKLNNEGRNAEGRSYQWVKAARWAAVNRRSTMKTKHIFAAISVATALAIITPAYAGGIGGGLGGGFGGGLGGGLSGMSGMNRGLSGQGAFQGQGAVGGSLDKPKLHPATTAVKQGSVIGDAAAQSAAGVSKTGTAGAANVADSTESTAKPNVSSSAAPSATAPKPAPSASLTGTDGLNATANKGTVATNGMVDAEHSSSGTSLDVAGTASTAASRNPQ
jgi:predicted lipid-binding transport protein (Tim44 family)